MSTVLYPIIGLLAGLFCGFAWKNALPGGLLAMIVSVAAGLLATRGLEPRTIDYWVIALGTSLAVGVSFFGSVRGAILRDHLERREK